MFRWCCALVLVPLMVGCGGSSDGDAPGSGGTGTGGAGTGGAGTGGASGSGGTSTGGVGGGESFTVDIGPIDVPAGYENTQCIVKRLHNPANFHVGLIAKQDQQLQPSHDRVSDERYGGAADTVRLLALRGDARSDQGLAGDDHPEAGRQAPAARGRGLHTGRRPDDSARAPLHQHDGESGAGDRVVDVHVHPGVRVQRRGGLLVHRQPGHPDPGQQQLDARAHVLPAPERVRRRELLRHHRPRAPFRNQRDGVRRG